MELTARTIPRPRKITGTGLETILDVVSVISLVTGGLLAVTVVILSGGRAFLPVLSILAGAFLNWLLLRCLAEHLRLQKKIAGLNYEGRITGSYEDVVLTCSNCGAVLHSDVSCDGCGARLLKPDSE